MKLPKAENLIISEEKLLEYILSETHATGKFKAKFFRNFGFNEENVDLFKQILIELTETYQIKEEIKSSYGTKYIIDGKINTPNGKIVTVRTVWIIEKNEQSPRLITIYPV